MSSSHEKGAWVISIASLALVVISCGLLLLGTLELSGLLGPLQVGPFSCRTWRPHNILACLLWLPTLGAAAWLLADSAHEKSTSGPGAVEGGRLLEASLAMAVIMVTGHAVVIVAYCLRAHQRAKAMRELPTQQLLSCAQQATRSNLGPSAAAAGAQSSSTSPPDPPFRLQFGRSDGAFGYTLFIPAEQEEEELRRAMQQYHPHNNAEAGVPLASNLTSSNTAVGPTGLGAGGRKMVKMRSLQEATESGAPGAAILSAPPPVVSFPKPSRSGGSSRNPSPFRRATHEAGELRSSWHGVRASTGVLPQRPLDPGGVALAFPGTHPPALDAPSGLPLQPLQPHRPPPPPPTHSAAAAVAAAAPAAPTAAPPPASSPWQLVEPRHQHQHQHRHQQQPQQPQQYAFPPAAEADRQAPTTPPGALAQPDGAAGQVAPPQLTPHATSQQPGPPAAPGSPAPPFMLGALDSHSHPNTPAFATPGPPSLPLQHPLSAPPYVAAGSPPPLLRRGSGTPTAQTSASPSCSSSITFQMQPSEQHSLGGYEDGLPPRSTTTVASWNEPEEPPQQHTPGRAQRRRQQQQHRRTRSHPVEPEHAGDRLDVSLLAGSGNDSPEQAEAEAGGQGAGGAGALASLRAKSGGLAASPQLWGDK